MKIHVVACLLVLGFSSAHAWAANITVNTTNDNAANDGQCTLREAITAANNNAPSGAAAGECAAGSVADDTISFTVTGIINLASPLPAITAGVTVSGPGAGLLTVRRNTGGTNFRVFDVNAPTPNVVTFSGLSVKDGFATDGGGIRNNSTGTVNVTSSTVSGNTAVQIGGGISSNGTLTVTNSTISGNTAGNQGGGIFKNGGTLTVTNSMLSGNSADAGGGIYNNVGTVGVTNTTLSGNPASGNGGGIHNSGTFTVTRSTLSGNSSNLSGAGIYNNGTLTVTTSTLSGNTANQVGGGIFNQDTATVTSSTLTGNIADEGGGIYNLGPLSVALRNSIVALNTAPPSPDVSGRILTQGFNIFGSTSGATPAAGSGPFVPASTDQTGVSAAQLQLGPLASNGGPTQTHRLIAGSVAIDKGDDGSVSPTTDQRGVLRPFDDPAIPPAAGGDNSDIGAYELQGTAAQAAPSFVVNTADDHDDGANGCTLGDCTLREAINAANGNAGTDTVTFDILDNGPHTIQLTGVLPQLSDSVNILNTSGEAVTVRRNTAFNYRIFYINNGQTVRLTGLTITNGSSPSDAGGGIRNEGTLTVTNSTVSGNTASSGGGILDGGTLTVTNSTISGNTATANGGGILYGRFPGTLTGVTITNNRGGSNSAGVGGGIFVNGSQFLQPLLRSTIVAGNFNQDSAADDIIFANPSGSIDGSSSFNLIGTGGAGGLTDGTNNNQVGVANPGLVALANNGGLTQTHALLPCSRAIDRGENFDSTTDQRGFPRPFDNPNNASNGDNTDIGAFESQDTAAAACNSAPTASATPNPVTTNEDTAVTITLTGTDADDNNLAFSITQQPSNGTLGSISAPNCSAANVCTASVTYTPNPNVSGADSLKFRVNDGVADSAEVTVNISVTAVNDVPAASAAPNPATTNEDTAVGITLTGTDADDNNLTFSITQQPSGGMLSAVSASNCAAVNTCTATVTYTPNANYNGADVFKFIVNDGTADSSEVTVNITVGAVNDAPQGSASPNPATTNEDTAVQITLSGTDAEGSNVTFSITQQPNGGMLSAISAPDCTAGNTCTATVTYTPSANGNGPDSFKFRVNDGTSDSAEVTVDLTVNAVNDAPTASATPNPATTNEDTAVQITLNGADADDNNLTFAITAQPTNGTLSAVSAADCTGVNTCTATVTYTPNEHFNGTDSFKFKANDGTLDSGEVTVGLTVSAVNDEPTASATPDPATTTEDTAVTITLNGTDSDDNDLTFAIATQPTNGTLGAISAPDCTAANTCTATVTYTPNADYNGKDSFEFRVNDGVVDSAVVTVDINVTAVNDAPTASATPNPATMDEDTPGGITITLTGTDVEDNDLTFTITEQPSNGTLGSISAPDCSAANTCTATVTYTPTADFSGADSFKFKVNDGTGDSNVVSVSITVAALPDTPTASAKPNPATTNEDTAVQITLTGTDADDDSLTFSATQQPTNGTLGAISVPDCAAADVCKATVTYTPNANYNGADSFKFRVTDGTGDSNEVTVNITVSAVNDTPVVAAAPNPATTDEGAAIQITLTGTDSDDNNLTFAITAQPGNGSLGAISAADCTATNSCTAKVTYTPNANYSGQDSFAFKANDGEADSNPVTVSITVNDVPEPSPSPSPSPSASPSPSPSASPTPTPPVVQTLNLSTRGNVLTGENVLISGIIVEGPAPSTKRVIMRALGPSLTVSQVPTALRDPLLELYDGSGLPLFENDNWRDTQQAEIEATKLQPSDNRESAIVMSLLPGQYTAVMSGADGGTGIGLTEIYDLNRESQATIANISTRGFVGTDNNVLIGGFILDGSGTTDVLVRAIGPSMDDDGVANTLQNPTLRLTDANGNGTFNDNWRTDQQSEISATTIPPEDNREAAIFATLPAGTYTAIVAGADGATGVALVEIYSLGSRTNVAR